MTETELSPKKQYVEQAKIIIKQACGPKYDAAGIYEIFIDNKLVYIGQSKNMLNRIVSHMWEIDYNIKTNKYIQLRRARDAGHKIRFDVLCYCSEDELNYQECINIRKFMPLLNYQIPRLEDGWDPRPLAKSITYEKILDLMD